MFVWLLRLVKVLHMCNTARQHSDREASVSQVLVGSVCNMLAAPTLDTASVNSNCCSLLPLPFVKTMQLGMVLHFGIDWRAALVFGYRERFNPV